jgi:hypothetical protein
MKSVVIETRQEKCTLIGSCELWHKGACVRSEAPCTYELLTRHRRESCTDPGSCREIVSSVN